MRVLVTGATGFVASHLLPELIARGDEVFGVVRRDVTVAAGVEAVRWDLTEAAPSLPGIDAIVHLAQGNVPFPVRARELYAVNTTAALALLDVARTAGARFVLASTGGVYGSGDRRFREDDPPAPEEAYAVTKLHAEQLAAAYAPFVESVVLRIFTPYGPGQRGRLVARLIDAVRAGRPVSLAGGHGLRLTPTYVGDLVRALLAALVAPPAVVNVAGDEAVSLRELTKRIAAVVGAEPVFEAVHGEARGVMGANERLRSHLGVHALVPLDEGLRRAVEAPAAV